METSFSDKFVLNKHMAAASGMMASDEEDGGHQEAIIRIRPAVSLG